MPAITVALVNYALSGLGLKLRDLLRAEIDYQNQ